MSFNMSFTLPPDAITPEFLAEDTGPTLIATASLMMISCTVFVGLRYWARYLNQTAFGAEDLMLPFAWIAEMGLCIVGIVMVKHTGAGRHTIAVLDEDPAILSKYLKAINVNEFLHPAAVAFPKLCVVLMYLRIFTNKYERMAAYVLIAIVAATWFSYTTATVFQCMPIAFAWDKTIEGGKCFDFRAFATSSSVPNIVTDVAVLFLPIRTVTELRISVGRKAGLMLIFLTGSVGIVASIIRTIVFASTDPLVDPTFTSIALLNWTMIEPGLYLLAACALSFKPLFRIVARTLHLNHLVTHTKSFSSHGITNRTTHSVPPVPVVIRMDTFKSASSGGFSKLSSGKDGVFLESPELESGQVVLSKDIEDGLKTAQDLEQRYTRAVNEGVISVMVTRTVEVESEEWTEEGNEDEVEMKFNVADQSFFLGMLETLDKRADAKI